MTSQPLNLLLIEDSQADFALISRHLSRHGIEASCRQIGSMEELCQALGEPVRWEVALSDYNLPGIEFADILTTIRIRCPDLPVIIVSGTIGEELAVELLKVGVTDFVLKDNLTRLEPAIFRALADASAVRSRREAELALHDREAQYTRLIDATFDCIWETDPAGCYTWISDRVQSLLGYAPAEVVGRHRTEFMAEDGAAKALFADIAQGHRPFDKVEAPFRHRDGRTLILESSGLPIIDPAGSFRGYMGASRDVTAQKKAEAEIHQQNEQLRRTLDALVRTTGQLERLTFAASHDLQEPIRNIVSFAQMIERRLGDHAGPDIRQDLAFMIQGAYHMRDIVAGLVQVSEVSRSTPAWAVLDGAMVLAGAERALQSEIGRSGAVITAGDLPQMFGDGDQLRELLICLLSNAIKFSRPGHPPDIRITASLCAEGWQVAVADNGLGIDEQYLEQIFLPFKRLKGGGEYPGVGLGLAISQRIVERHGGRIWAESTPGQGTTVLFTLPVLAP